MVILFLMQHVKTAAEVKLSTQNLAVILQYEGPLLEEKSKIKQSLITIIQHQKKTP